MILPRPIQIEGKRCAFCKLEPGEYIVSRAGNGDPTAIRIACPVCAYADILPLIFEPRQLMTMRERQIVSLDPGWRCTWPSCGRHVTIHGERFIVTERPR